MFYRYLMQWSEDGESWMPLTDPAAGTEVIEGERDPGSEPPNVAEQIARAIRGGTAHAGQSFRVVDATPGPEER